MDLTAYESIHLIERSFPVLIGRLMKSLLDVFRIDRRQRHQDGSDTMLAALSLDLLQVRDHIRCRSAGSKTVRPTQDEKVLRRKRKHVLLEALDHRLTRIPALGKIDRRKVQIRLIAVGKVSRPEGEMTAAVRNAVAIDSHLPMLHRIFDLLRQAPLTHGLPCAVHSPDAPVVRPRPRSVIVEVGELGRIRIDAMDGGREAMEIFRIL